MRALGTVVAVLAALIWSGLVWGGYALLMVSSDFLARNAGWDGLPYEATYWASLLDDLLQDYGTGIAAAIWAVGLLGILALRTLYNWVVGLAAPEPARQAPPPQPVTAVPQPAPRPAPPPPAAVPSLPSARPEERPRWGRNAGRT